MSDVTFDMLDNKMHVHQNNAEDWKVTLVHTGYNTMTGGRLKRIAPYLDDNDFCFTYGDGVADFQTIEEFDADLQGNLYKLLNRLASGYY